MARMSDIALRALAGSGSSQLLANPVSLPQPLALPNQVRNRYTSDPMPPLRRKAVQKSPSIGSVVQEAAHAKARHDRSSGQLSGSARQIDHKGFTVMRKRGACIGP